MDVDIHNSLAKQRIFQRHSARGSVAIMFLASLMVMFGFFGLESPRHL